MVSLIDISSIKHIFVELAIIDMILYKGEFTAKYFYFRGIISIKIYSNLDTAQLRSSVVLHNH